MVYAAPRYYVRPYHGVFVYGPSMRYHTVYYENGSRPQGAVKVEKRHLPKRAVDRSNTLAIGVKAGSYFGAWDDANSYADVGLGLNARYRPMESIGLDLAVSHHMDDERTHTSGSASAEVFAFPWKRVSPYILAGATYTDRNISDTIWRNEQLQTVTTNAPLAGVHGGAGVELAIGKKVALDLEARYIGYVNRLPEDPSLPGAFTTSAGVMWHF